MRLRLLPWLVPLALALPLPAWAECPTKYPLSSLAEDLGVMQKSLRSLDEESFKGAGTRISTGLPCMAQPAPTPVYATAYRLLGAWYHLGGDPQEALGWFRIATELDPSFAWDVQDFDAGHPIRKAYEAQRNVTREPVAVPGRALSVPAGSKLLIDGRPLVEAAATPDRPHLIQQVGGDKAVRASWLVRGNALPEVLLQSPAASAGPALVVSEGAPPDPSRTEPKEKKEKKERKSKEPVAATESQPAMTDDGVLIVQRARPPMKTPLLVLGGASIAGAGALYATSFLARDEFEAATTTDEVLAARTRVNTLVLAAGGTALLGVGLGYWGVLLDDGFQVGLHGRF